jgi:transcriptional regulator GlxA family with amidase domain
MRPSLKAIMSSQLFSHEVAARTDQFGSVYTSRIRSAQGGIASSGPDRRIEVVVMLLQSNSHKQIAIEEMAKLVNLSPGRLAHLFKSEMEVSIQRYLTQVRLAKAKTHLESSFLSIKEIAASVGFSSVTRFVVCFKNLVGATPAQYRKHFPHASYERAEITP